MMPRLLSKLAICLFLPATLQVQAASLYRYVDDTGKQVVGSQVPPAFVRNGYEVLDEQGRVIETVPRQFSAEDKAVRAEKLEQERLAEAARLQREEEDRQLLEQYRSPEEIIRQRDAVIGELKAQLSVLETLLEAANENTETARQAVASIEDTGRDIPPDVLLQYAGAVEERDRLENQVARLKQERKDTQAAADKNIRRLKKLLDLD